MKCVQDDSPAQDQFVSIYLAQISKLFHNGPCDFGS